MSLEPSPRKGEYELKFAFPDIMSSTIDSWLRFNCRVDAAYPSSRVQSIYYESRDLLSLAGKINSDYFKTKYRLRWYESPDGKRDRQEKNTTVFLEKKQKIGAQRVKERTLATAEFDQLTEKGLDSAYHQDWCEQFTRDLEVSPRLFPFIQLSYIRKRFIDRHTGARLSLDYGIRVEKTNLCYLQPAFSRKLDQGVFEIKGDSASPPPALHFLTQHFARKTAFSKFERCVALVL